MKVLANKQLNHTTSHLLAAAVQRLYPGVKMGFGPATDEGFYYDFDFPEYFSVDELAKIERTMKQLASRNLIMIEDQASNYSFEDKPYKKELYDEFIAQNKNVTFYSLKDPQNGEIIFTDLCAGNHMESTKNIKHFKLLSIAGAYWRGNSDNKQLTRIYGTCWETKEELDNYLSILQERKERDHRKIGKELNYFAFSPLVGQGFPIWLEDGMYVHNQIRNLVLALDKKYGFTEVLTPHFGAELLYQTSGHLAHYKDDMFPAMKLENEKLIPRPMTCPHHIVCYKLNKHSYRDLPIRYSEQSQLYRYEKSGALTGLERVRGMLLTEGHLFVRVDQIKEEIKKMYSQIKEILEIFKIDISYISLSLRDKNDKEKYFNDDKIWNEAEAMLKEALDELKIKYTPVEGEAAFYGPKIDIQIDTALGHEITVSTIQLDFLQPEKFELTYVDSQNQETRPVMIHRGLIGTYERFVAILLEQTKGVLPFWIAPKQITIIPVNNEENLKYCQKVEAKLLEKGFRVKIDSRDERLNKKIREAQINKSKFNLILGANEQKDKTISYRKYGQEKTYTVKLNTFIKELQNLIKNYE
ncbi:threonine--tRNA ligase [Mycoplasmopsis hyopharyngis]|uniref:threonine--tRNA ligase n=1 Tax=Mycoplasmopsis hyopharyngis TaxID=29558 RepID=UPI0038733691